MTTVPDRLKNLSKLYADRNAQYGDNYLKFGAVMAAIFPDGITLKTAEHHNRFALFVQMAHKLTRYARSINRGGHEDSLDDLAVYAQMAQEFDAMSKPERSAEAVDRMRGKPGDIIPIGDISELRGG